MTTLICQNRPCKKHGIVERTKEGKCKVCVSEYAKTRYEKNKDFFKKRALEYSKRTSPRKRESRKDYLKEYRRKEENKQKFKRYMVSYNEKNPYSTSTIKSSILSMRSCIKTGLKARDIPKELVDLKVLQIKLLRAIKNREMAEH